QRSTSGLDEKPVHGYRQSKQATRPCESRRRMARRRFLGNISTLVVLAAVYFAAGKLGLKLAHVNASASAILPSTGISLAAFLILGYLVWPAHLVGAFLVYFNSAGYCR